MTDTARINIAILAQVLFKGSLIIRAKQAKTIF